MSRISAIPARGWRHLARFYAYHLTAQTAFTAAIRMLFLPHRGSSLGGIGPGEAVFHAAPILLDVPSGSFADLVGRRWSLAVISMRVFRSAVVVFGAPAPTRPTSSTRSPGLDRVSMPVRACHRIASGVHLREVGTAQRDEWRTMPTADKPGERRVPRLAPDAWRAWTATALAIVPATALDSAGFGLGPEASPSALYVENFFVTWLCYGAVYLALTSWIFLRADGQTLACWQRATTPRSHMAHIGSIFSGGASAVWTVASATISIVAVIAFASVPDLRTSTIVLTTGITAVAGSWLLNAVGFAVLYARTNTARPGLVFPGDAAPAFIDYVYLAVQGSTIFSTADVPTTSSRLRRTVTGHAIIAFIFNTVIVAVLVSELLTVAP